ncbi:protein valois [Musca vetustissima]|uniref:protein valois n=1 Tax=Musca vetustissima TaxID=27455 RepID=UPI002AB62611|nr:protein valois [Musca vetustissima]
MLPLSYGNVYKTPDDYKPPDDLDFDDTEYPNLNSRDYARRPLNHTARMHEAWECLSISTTPNEAAASGNVAVCCNKLSGREWTGTLWGFEKHNVLEDKNEAMTPGKSCFKLQCPAIINGMTFVSPNILLLAFNTGNLQVWSTHSEVRKSQNPYCLFLIGEKCEHMRPITCLSNFPSNQHKAVTGSKDGTLKIWDMGTADLVSQGSYRFAHTDSITGVSAARGKDNIFATCSLDKSCLLWDDRETRPAIALYENHSVRFTNVTWCPQSDDSKIYLGDEAGAVLTIDVRQPKQIETETQYFERPIRKIIPNDENLAIISDSNLVKIAKSSTHSVFYKNSESENFVRDGAWITNKEFLTIGFEGKLRSHSIE